MEDKKRIYGLMSYTENKDEYKEIDLKMKKKAEELGYDLEYAFEEEAENPSAVRTDLIEFVLCFAVDTEVIMVDKPSTISVDDVERRVFEAAMAVMGIKIFYLNVNEYTVPDAIYERELKMKFEQWNYASPFNEVRCKYVKTRIMFYQMFYVMYDFWRNARDENLRRYLN